MDWEEGGGGDELGIDHHQRLASTAPEDTGVVEARNVDVGFEFPFAVLGWGRRYTECRDRRDASHATCWANVMDVVLGTRLFPWSRVLAIANKADICFAEDILLVISIGNDAADDQILIFGPVRQGDDRWIPKYSSIGLCARWNLRNVLNNGWKTNMVGKPVWFQRALEQDVKGWIEQG